MKKQNCRYEITNLWGSMADGGTGLKVGTVLRDDDEYEDDGTREWVVCDITTGNPNGGIVGKFIGEIEDDGV